MRQAWKYTLPAFLVPIMFCITPTGLHLLMITSTGSTPQSIADFSLIGLTALLAGLALACFTAALTGYAHRPLTSLERSVAGLMGIALLYVT